MGRIGTGSADKFLGKLVRIAGASLEETTHEGFYMSGREHIVVLISSFLMLSYPVIFEMYQL